MSGCWLLTVIKSIFIATDLVSSLCLFLGGVK